MRNYRIEIPHLIFFFFHDLFISLPAAISDFLYINISFKIPKQTLQYLINVKIVSFFFPSNEK